MSRPISVLTGIDTWLDGLMCNVPEVLMCYHLNGIVQKYELIKTGRYYSLQLGYISGECEECLRRRVTAHGGLRVR